MTVESKNGFAMSGPTLFLLFRGMESYGRPLTGVVQATTNPCIDGSKTIDS